MKECNCDVKFRTAEDYRDHLPCSAIGKLSKEEEEVIKKLREEKAFEAWEPGDIKNIPDAEKIEKFDSIYAFALEMYNYKRENGYGMKDQEHYCFESIMGLLGPDVWKHWNKLSR